MVLRERVERGNGSAPTALKVEDVDRLGVVDTGGILPAHNCKTVGGITSDEADYLATGLGIPASAGADYLEEAAGVTNPVTDLESFLGHGVDPC